MRMFDSILLATDFRRSSQNAAHVAVELTTVFGSTVTVFHVREPFPTWPVAPHENQEQLVAHLKAQKVDVTNLHFGVGPVADTIVRKARELDTDLLLMGAGEKMHGDHLVVGPVTISILEQSPIPVLAVHPNHSSPKFKTILCPVDHSEISRRGLERALQLGQAFGASVIVLSVVPKVSWLTAAVETGTVDEPRLEYETAWVAEFDRFLSSVSFGTVTWRREVRLGEPHEQILAAAREHRADLLVMGATGRTGLVRVLLGSVTRRVLQELPCSLLAVKDDELDDVKFDEDMNVLEHLMAEGRELAGAGNHVAAAARFRQVLARNPFDAGALEELARACDSLGHTRQAQQARHRIQRLQRRS